MNDDELKQVLTKIQLGDHRQVDLLVLREWRDSIGNLRFADAIEAVTMHRQESTEYLQAAHLHRNVARIRADRADRQRTLELTRDTFQGDPKPDNWEAMCAAYKDPVAFAREVAIYDQQLVDAGFAPTSPRYERGWAA